MTATLLKHVAVKTDDDDDDDYVLWASYGHTSGAASDIAAEFFFTSSRVKQQSAVCSRVNSLFIESEVAYCVSRNCNKTKYFNEMF